MSPSKPEIRLFDRMAATDQQFATLNDLRNAVMAVATPDDPPNTVENTRMQLQNIPPVFEFHGWVAWDGDRAVGFANAVVPRMETNQHLIQMDISVAPESRRDGLATAFLPAIVELARRENRRMVMANTWSTIPAGERFMEALGGNVGLSMRRNDLLVADLDRPLLRRWIDRARERAGAYDIVEFTGPYPEAELGRISEMQKAINGMPTDTLDVEDFEFTPDHLKQMDESMVAQGGDRWSLVAREKLTGAYVGWTDMTFNPRKPKLADVGGTAVYPEHQNHGLGRWLKAAILDKLLREKPEVERVRTGNAHSNAPMLKINDELGFKPALTMNLWQVDTDRVSEYLERRTAALV